MSGKMESSLWRPLQIAILIQILTSTVLCNKKIPEPVADDVDGCWTKFPDTHIEGGVEVPAEDLADCQYMCLQTSDCQSIDFKPTKNGCDLLNTQDNKETKKGIDHYDLGCKDVNDGWEDWSVWTRCSVTCGYFGLVGYATRTRQCGLPKPSNGGQQCNGESTEKKACKSSQCH